MTKTTINAGAFSFNDVFEAAAKLDQLALTAKPDEADELFAKAQGLRNVAGIMAANMMITLAGNDAPAAAQINGVLDDFNKVLAKIKKVEQAIQLATAAVVLLGALMTGQVKGIVAAMSALRDAVNKTKEENEGKKGVKKDGDKKGDK